MEERNLIFRFSSLKAEEPVQPISPCQPSPCGPNAICQVINNSPSCSCKPEFIGTPPNCKPECISNSECNSHLACIERKCRDPCTGSCGSNAECHVVNHVPSCICAKDFTGDPFVQCIVRQRKCLEMTRVTQAIP
ncbi:hypothetical protein K0M31_011886 [Melipona bicolor]|uniref:EGF-like domain-containing protein n=1 Tax=Melipona bicolor TaxID=60889 RepID=A0AA40KVF8_9HYME|nr:hypothetical protein K0M31_011886 [Melipona bicolor]